MSSQNEPEKLLSTLGKSLYSSVTGTIAGAAVLAVTEAVSDLKKLDSYLTRISAANAGLSKADLTRIAEKAYDAASKYGKTASEYLSSLQKMYERNTNNAEELAELSLRSKARRTYPQSLPTLISSQRQKPTA